MKCNVCGAQMKKIETDLPFKISETAIIIIKNLPVLQCSDCREYLIEDAVMDKVDLIIEHADKTAELEIVSFAA